MGVLVERALRLDIVCGDWGLVNGGFVSWDRDGRELGDVSRLPPETQGLLVRQTLIP